MIYLCAVGIARRIRPDRVITLIVILFSIIFRIITIPGVPILENDFNRYIWDGAVFSSGINPYKYSPDADTDEFNNLKKNPLIDNYHANICYPDVPTIYPPVAQLIFLISYRITPVAGMELLTFKTVIVLFDLLTLLMIIKLLLLFKLPGHHALIYGWSPLVIKEFSNSGHMDTAGIFFLILSIYLLLDRKYLMSAMTLALSFCIKLYPVVAIPLFLKQIKRSSTAEIKTFLACFTFGVLVFYMPFVGCGTNLFTGLLTFSNEWQINDSFFAVVSRVSRMFIPDDMIYSLSFGAGGFKSYGRYYLLAAKIFSGLVFLVILISVQLREWINNQDLFKNIFIFLASLFLLGPVGNPWYFCWLIPFLCVVRSRSFLFLSCLLFLYYPVIYLETCPGTYGIQIPGTGLSVSKSIIMLVEYVPFYLLIMYGAVNSIRNRNREIHQS